MLKAGQAFQTLLCFLKDLLTAQSLPFWEAREGRGAKRCSRECVKAGRAGAAAMKDPHAPAAEKGFGFRREFYNFHFVLVGG